MTHTLRTGPSAHDGALGGVRLSGKKNKERLSIMNDHIFNLINGVTGRNSAVDDVIVFFAVNMQYVLIVSSLWVIFHYLGKKQPRIPVTLLSSFVVCMISDRLIETFYYHARPFVVEKVHLLIRHSATTSFPSTHAIFMFSVSIPLLLFRETRCMGLFLFFLSLIGGISRVYVGVHYPLDILGSLIVSVIVSLFCFFLYSIGIRHQQKNISVTREPHE